MPTGGNLTRVPGSRNPAKDDEGKVSMEIIQSRNSVWYSNSFNWAFCLNPPFTKGEKFQVKLGVSEDLGHFR